MNATLPMETISNGMKADVLTTKIKYLAYREKNIGLKPLRMEAAWLQLSYLNRYVNPMHRS